MGSIVIGAGISTPVAHFFAFYYGVLADITGVHSTDVNCGHWRGHRELTFRPICRPSLFENAAPCMNGRFGEATLQHSAVKRRAGKGRLIQAGTSAPARCCITAFGKEGLEADLRQRSVIQCSADTGSAKRRRAAERRKTSCPLPIFQPSVPAAQFGTRAVSSARSDRSCRSMFGQSACVSKDCASRALIRTKHPTSVSMRFPTQRGNGLVLTYPNRSSVRVPRLWCRGSRLFRCL